MEQKHDDSARAGSGRGTEPAGEYHGADDCYRQARYAADEAQAIAISSSQQRQMIEIATDLLEASRNHRHRAADALSSLAIAQDEDRDRLEHTVQSQSRLCRQTAIRALMALAGQHARSSANARLDRYLPMERGPIIIVEGDDGNLAAMGTTTVFGSNPVRHLGARPQRTAQQDLATNLLTQRTRDWHFAEEHRQDFVREFLMEAEPGHIIDEDTFTAWVNRRRAGAMSGSREPVTHGQYAA